MKHFIMMCLLTFSAYASADALIMDNEAGGKIVLTEKVCYLEGGEKFGTAYTWSFDSELTIKGCWTFQDGIIFVLWDSPNGFLEKAYDPRNFELKETI